ncbi:MAG: SUMF1/EgtB/PvdO family nonheme iron enzyme [Planctomycetota bacterium]|nr:SUMF1/EgtB/PvdO family nonheme iron enzyme [Planctomycetota bacterium]
MAKKTELTRELIKQYIWKRYIDLTSNYPDVNDIEAIEVFERYYAKHPVNEDDECFYFGVLCFEAAWCCEDKQKQARLILKAKEILEIYRTSSEEQDWVVVEDRLEECRDFIAENNLEATASAIISKPKIVDGMILVEAGKFLFGEAKEEKFLEAFYVDILPVSNKDYRKFIEEQNYRNPRVWDEFPEFAKDDMPVTGISWMDALQYCKWANKELPTEEQWEKAARGVKGHTYPWGDDAPTAEHANFAHEDNGAPSLATLTGYDANESSFGCKYTVGHAWEWTSTTHQGEGRHRVIKGGCWADPSIPQFLSAHARNWASVKAKSELIGFRCARPSGMM